MQPKWGAVVLAALTVAACGGGGGSSDVPAGVSTTGATASPQVSLGASAGLSYADFGYWNTPTGPANYYASGMQTPAAQLPPSGANITATYNGVYAETHTAYQDWRGATITVPAASGTGGIQISANFGSHTVGTNFTSGPLATFFGGPGELGVISGAAYTVTYPNTSNYFVAGLTVSGAFYGPSNPSLAPLETAGTLTGFIGLNTGSPGQITGSFGAHR